MKPKTIIQTVRVLCLLIITFCAGVYLSYKFPEAKWVNSIEKTPFVIKQKLKGEHPLFYENIHSGNMVKDPLKEEYLLSFSYYQNDSFHAELIKVPEDTILKSLSISQLELFEYLYDTAFNAADDAPIIIKDQFDIRKTRAMAFRFEGDRVYFHLMHGPLLCYSLDGNLIWKNDDYIFHHSIELDRNGDIWSCGLNRETDSLKNLQYLLVKLDPITGQTLYSQSVSYILRNTIYNRVARSNIVKTGDIYHLNDIEPAMYSTKHWDSTDILVSLRNPNLVMLYDPISDNIKWMCDTLGVQQHDIDFVDDESVSIFSNNYNHNYQKWVKPHNSVKVFNFNDSSSTTVKDDILAEYQVKTRAQGQAQLLPNSTLFVEETNPGIAYIIEGENVRMYFKRRPDRPNELSMLGWCNLKLLPSKHDNSLSRAGDSN